MTESVLCASSWWALLCSLSWQPPKERCYYPPSPAGGLPRVPPCPPPSLCSASRDSLALVLWQGSGHGCIPWPRHAPPQGSLFKWSSPSCSSAWSYPCPFKMRCAFPSPRLLSSHCDFLPLITPSWAVSPFITTSHTIPVPKYSNNSAEILSDRSDAWLGFIASEA